MFLFGGHTCKQLSTLQRLKEASHLLQCFYLGVTPPISGDRTRYKERWSDPDQTLSEGAHPGQDLGPGPSLLSSPHTTKCLAAAGTTEGAHLGQDLGPGPSLLSSPHTTKCPAAAGTTEGAHLGQDLGPGPSLLSSPHTTKCPVAAGTTALILHSHHQGRELDFFVFLSICTAHTEACSFQQANCAQK